MRHKRTFTYYTDPGHGWLKVPGPLLRELGIDEKITPYSYVNAGHAYLEEDLDMTTFLNAYRAHYGHEAIVNDRGCGTYSTIRTYDSYTPSVASLRPPYAAGQLWLHPRTTARIKLTTPMGRRGWACTREDLNDGMTYRAPLNVLAKFVFVNTGEANENV